MSADHPRSGVVLAVGSRFTSTSKALQVQTLAAQTTAGGAAETAFADVFQGWYVVAPPPTQTVDAGGTITAATEFLTCEVGDQPTMHGSRDTRTAQFGQDTQPGEFALINSLGYRLFVGHSTVGITAGGGFLNFDIANKKVGLCGIPTAANQPVPYLSIEADSIGLVSKNGQGSVNVSNSQTVITGPVVALEGGRINLGVGAVDPIMTYTQQQAIISQLLAWGAAVVAACLAAPGGAIVIPPLVIINMPGRRVFAPVA